MFGKKFTEVSLKFLFCFSTKPNQPTHAEGKTISLNRPNIVNIFSKISGIFTRRCQQKSRLQLQKIHQTIPAEIAGRSTFRSFAGRGFVAAAPGGAVRTASAGSGRGRPREGGPGECRQGGVTVEGETGREKGREVPVHRTQGGRGVRARAHRVPARRAG